MKALDKKIVDWRKYLNEEISEEHKCAGMLPGVAVLNGTFCTSSQLSWMMAIFSVASEKDVVDGEAEYIGELLNEQLLAINFCPFCGKEL
jgi:hypothetical protein